MFALTSACSPFGSGIEDGAQDGGRPDGASGPAIGICADAGDAFCDDFEREEVTGAWTVHHRSGSSTLTIDDAHASSPSRSLRVFMPAGGNASAHWISYPSKANARTFELSFSMRFASLPDATVELASIAFGDGGEVSLTWQAARGQLLIGEQDDPDGGTGRYNTAAIGVPPIGAFIRYDLIVDLDQKKVRLATSAPGLGGGLTLKFHHASSQQVSIGSIDADRPSADWTVWFDDVVIR